MNTHDELMCRLDQWIAEQTLRHKELTAENVLGWLLRQSALSLYETLGAQQAERIVLETARELAFIETIENYPRKTY